MDAFELRWVRRSPSDDPFLAGRSLLRSLAAELTGMREDDVRIVAICRECGGPHGRPFIEGSALQVGLSHCRTATVAVASWKAPVGVDVEDLPGTPAAVEAIGTLTGTAELRHWTRIEAVLKADGRGLRVDPARVAIHDLGSRVEADVAGSPVRYRLRQPQLDAGLVVSVATSI